MQCKDFHRNEEVLVLLNGCRLWRARIRHFNADAGETAVSSDLIDTDVVWVSEFHVFKLNDFTGMRRVLKETIGMANVSSIQIGRMELDHSNIAKTRKEQE